MSNSMSDALKVIVSDIITKSIPVPVIKKHKIEKTKQYINGYEVKWVPHCADTKPIPTIQDRDNTFYIQFPTKRDDISIPVGTVRATYNKDKARVEYFLSGSNEPIKTINDQKHEPLPLPKYFSHLESIEETFNIDMESGDIISMMKINVLSEPIHWKLRLQEYEKNQKQLGNGKFVIDRKINRYVKSLISLRGITQEQLDQPIPESILMEIENAKKQIQIRSF